MQPQKRRRQRLMSFELELDPAAQLFSYADSFGNAVYHFDVPAAARPAAPSSPAPRSRPRRRRRLPEALDMGEWDRLQQRVRPAASASISCGRTATQRRTPALDAFIERHGPRPSCAALDPLTRRAALSQAIYEAFDYEAGRHRAPTARSTTRSSAGRGVCQDFAHIMIAICRGWGVPARYVSGYLFTDRDAPRPLRPGRHPRLGRGLPAVAALGGVRSHQQHHAPASGTWSSPSAATTATCRPRAGSSRARPRASWRSASRCAGPRRRGRAGVPAHGPPRLRRRPAPPPHLA